MNSPLNVHYGEDLTDREKQVLIGIAHGKTNNELCGELFLSIFYSEDIRRHAISEVGCGQPGECCDSRYPKRNSSLPMSKSFKHEERKYLV